MPSNTRISDKRSATEPSTEWLTSERLDCWQPNECTTIVARKPRTRRRKRVQHEGPAREEARSSPLFVGNNIWSSIHRSPTTPGTAIYTWDKEALGAYKGYKKLLGERKFAREFPVQTVSFLDLAAEIRNKILGYALIVSPIDLCAKSGRMGRANQVRSEHHRNYVYKIKPKLGLLRLNKQINEEASQIFYGLNDFRFTGRCGHDMLHAFCKTIGKHNTLRLTNITEHVPWAGDSSNFRDRPAHASKNSWQNFKEMLVRRGYHQRGRWSGNSTIEQTLTRNDSLLLRYTIVLPDELDLANASWDGVTEEEDLTYCFDFHHTGSLLPELEYQQDTSKVQITLVLLAHADAPSKYTDYGTRCKQTVMRQKATEYAWARDWRVSVAFMYDEGQYVFTRVGVQKCELLELEPGVW